jgi:hypothetical protein
MSGVLSPFGAGASDTWVAKLSLAAAPFPIEMINNTTITLTNGFFIAALVRPISGLITNLGAFITSASITPTGVNGMGLYSGAGVLLGQTGDLSSTWSGATPGTYVEAPISGGPVSVSTSADYYVAALGHNTTPPGIGVFFAGAGVSYPAVKGNVPVIADSGHATMPTSFNPATAGVGTAGYWFVAS